MAPAGTARKLLCASHCNYAKGKKTVAKFLQVEKEGGGWFEVAGSASIQRAGSATGRTAGAPRRFLARRGRGVRVGARRRAFQYAFPS